MTPSALRLAGAAWLVLLPFVALPFPAAARGAPPGQAFLGTIFYPDDFYQYLSFAEQASRGAFVFVNKFDATPHAPFLVNLEWWTAGRLGALLGGDLVLAFHLLGFLALLALVAGVVGALEQLGLSGKRLALGLALVFTGGGLGWLRLLQGVPGWQVPDLVTGLYPWQQGLSNAHFVLGTALLLWSVLSYLAWRRGQAPKWRWIALSVGLGLSRPYDLLVFAAVVAGGAAWDAASRKDPRAILAGAELLWLLPVFAYYGLVTRAHPSYAGWGIQSGDLSPPVGEYAWAVAPAALLVLAFRRNLALAERPLQRALALWCAALAVLLVAWSSPLAKQCLVSGGVALLLLAASLLPGRALAISVVLLSPTSALLLWTAFHPSPASYVPSDYVAAAQALRGACKPGDVAIAPTDLSLVLAGLTPCHVVLGHRLLTPRFAQEAERGRRFYEAGTAPAWRRSYLREKGARFAFLPAGREGWLGPDPTWTRVLSRPLFDVWARRPEL
jgi:hypothetical protein